MFLARRPLAKAFGVTSANGASGTSDMAGNAAPVAVERSGAAEIQVLSLHRSLAPLLRLTQGAQFADPMFRKTVPAVLVVNFFAQLEPSSLFVTQGFALLLCQLRTHAVVNLV